MFVAVKINNALTTTQIIAVEKPKRIAKLDYILFGER